MSEVQQITPVLSTPEPQEPQEPRSPRRRHLRRALWTGSGLIALLIIAIVGLIIWSSSSRFEDMVRRRLVSRIEAATGGRAEIAALHWHLLKLDAEAHGVVIHGLESPSELPYAQIESLHVQLSILGFWSPRVLLRNLEIVRPQFHVIVYPDGSTNQPQPRKKTSSARHPLDTLFDLEAGQVSVENGVIHYDDRAADFDFQDRQIPLNFSAKDVSLRLTYVPSNGRNPESYRVETGAHDLHLVRGPIEHPVARPVQGFVQATVDLTRNAAYLRSLRLTAYCKGETDHVLDVSGQLDDFNHPRWQANVKGELDLRLMEPVLGYPFTPDGIARVDLAGQGAQGLFRIDGNVHAQGASYTGTGVNAHGVGLDAKVHADPEQLLITSVLVRLQQGGQLQGEVLLDHWIAPLSGSPVMQAAAAPQKKESRTKIQPRTVTPPPPAHQVPVDLHTNGKVNAVFKDVTLDTLLDLVSLPPYRRLGFDTYLNGPSTAVWSNGDVRTLSVSANFGLIGTGRYVAGETPATGAINGTYTQRDGAVDLRKLELNLPDSQVVAHGHVGAYPITSPMGIAIDFRSHNLGEFNTLFHDLGLQRSGREGTAALPLSLGGEANFHGNWTGSLVDPHLAGTFQATNLTVEIPSTEEPSSQPQKLVHWDSLEAAGSYSATRIAIDHGHLRHGDAFISLDGTLTAVGAPANQGMPRFDSNALLHARLSASGVNIDDLQPFLPQLLPVTGILSTEVDAEGPIGTLGGNGWIQIDNGAIENEPIATMRAQGKIVGKVVQVASLSVANSTGRATASGSYDLRSRQFQVNAKADGVDIAKINRIRDTGTQLSGKLAFSVSGSGTLDDPRLEGRVTLAGLTLGGDPFGEVHIQAHTSKRNLIYDITSQLQAAELSAHGQTALDGDKTTQAELSFSRFNIGSVLRLAHITNLTGESALAGTVSLQGPLAKPQELQGEAHLRELAVTLAGVHLRSDGAVHASLANSKITLDPLHVIGEETDMQMRGALSITEKRQLDFAASGTINLKLAETIDPDLTASGTTTFKVEAHGPLQNPNLTGRVDFQDASLALEDLPNSLSQLRGTLEFNRDRLEVKSLTAMSGGGLLSVSGYLAYRHGLYADLSLTGKSIRIRYPQGVSSAADIALQLQGPQNNLLLSGGVMLTRFSVSPDVDFVALASQTAKAKPLPPANAPSNHVRLDVRIQSSPQLNFQNAYAKLAGDVDLRLRGTVASPSLLGRISVTEGSATIAGTRYELQRGEIAFTNPVRISPLIDLNATARVQDYDITLGLHGSIDQMNVSYRSDPPLPESDVVALLALGRTQDQQRLYTQQQEQLAANQTTDVLLGGALNATVSSRVQRLFGAGSVKVDPNHLGVLGNSTARITVEEQLGKNLTLTYATDVDTTAQELLQADIAINRHVSLVVARDESGVFSMVIKATRRFR
jgi:translocation and assembly module TamB